MGSHVRCVYCHSIEKGTTYGASNTTLKNYGILIRRHTMKGIRAYDSSALCLNYLSCHDMELGQLKLKSPRDAQRLQLTKAYKVSSSSVGNTANPSRHLLCLHIIPRRPNLCSFHKAIRVYTGKSLFLCPKTKVSVVRERP